MLAQASSTEQADALVLHAIKQLHGTGLSPPSRQGSAERALQRIIEANIGAVLGHVLATWHTVCCVINATLPVEDEVFIAQRELRRAQCLVESLTMAAAQTALSPASAHCR